VKPLIYWMSGMNVFMSNSPIKSTDDFKKLVMNASSVPFEDYLKALDSGIATLPFAEYYEGLSRGTIDGILYPPYALDTSSLHEVVDYITVPGFYSAVIGTVSISKKSWDELPPDLQEIILDVASELQETMIDGSKEYTQYGLDFAKENNVEIIKMSKDDYDEFFKLGQEEVWDKFANINDRTKKMVDVLYLESEEWIKNNPDSKEVF